MSRGHTRVARARRDEAQGSADGRTGRKSQGWALLRERGGPSAVDCDASAAKVSEGKGREARGNCGSVCEFLVAHCRRSPPPSLPLCAATPLQPRQQGASVRSAGRLAGATSVPCPQAASAATFLVFTTLQSPLHFSRRPSSTSQSPVLRARPPACPPALSPRDPRCHGQRLVCD